MGQLENDDEVVVDQTPGGEEVIPEPEKDDDDDNSSNNDYHEEQRKEELRQRIYSHQNLMTNLNTASKLLGNMGLEDIPEADYVGALLTHGDVKAAAREARRIADTETAKTEKAKEILKNNKAKQDAMINKALDVARESTTKFANSLMEYNNGSYNAIKRELEAEKKHASDLQNASEYRLRQIEEEKKQKVTQRVNGIINEGIVDNYSKTKKDLKDRIDSLSYTEEQKTRMKNNLDKAIEREISANAIALSKAYNEMKGKSGELTSEEVMNYVGDKIPELKEGASSHIMDRVEDEIKNLIEAEEADMKRTNSDPIVKDYDFNLNDFILPTVSDKDRLSTSEMEKTYNILREAYNTLKDQKDSLDTKLDSGKVTEAIYNHRVNKLNDLITKVNIRKNRVNRWMDEEYWQVYESSAPITNIPHTNDTPPNTVTTTHSSSTTTSDGYDVFSDKDDDYSVGTSTSGGAYTSTSG